MPQTLQTFVGGTNILTPAQFPEEAKCTAGAFGPSQVLNAGHVLAKSIADGLLYPYNAGNTNLAAAVGLNMYTLATDANGNVFYNNGTSGSVLNVPLQTSPYFIAGTFDVADLFNYGSNAANSLGARTSGGTSTAGGFIRLG